MRSAHVKPSPLLFVNCCSKESRDDEIRCRECSVSSFMAHRSIFESLPSIINKSTER